MRYLNALKLVLFIAALNSLVWLMLSGFAPETVSTVLFNLVRVILTFIAGWVIVARNIGGLWSAALGGVLVFFVDHLIITGGYFLLSGEYQAFIGVMLSFLMFFWIDMLLGVIGGVACKRRLSHVSS